MRLKYLIVLLVYNRIGGVRCKGTAVIGASGGGSEGDFKLLLLLLLLILLYLCYIFNLVCAECGKNYTNEELEFSLIILIGILCLFFVVLCCQCVSRVLHHCNRNKVSEVKYWERYKNLPPPSYVRKINCV